MLSQNDVKDQLLLESSRLTGIRMKLRRTSEQSTTTQNSGGITNMPIELVPQQRNFQECKLRKVTRGKYH